MLFNKDFSFQIESPVKGSREEIWRHITQMKNVNAELRPYAKMTFPADKAELDKRELPVNETLFVSVILLFGFIPADLHYLKFDRLETGYAFYENSTTVTHRYWKHTRSIIEKGNSFLVRDEVHFEPRVPIIGYLMLPLYKTIFKNRHRKLTASLLPPTIAQL